jgi:hypothetical protein
VGPWGHVQSAGFFQQPVAAALIGFAPGVTPGPVRPVHADQSVNALDGGGEAADGAVGRAGLEEFVRPHMVDHQRQDLFNQRGFAWSCGS